MSQKRFMSELVASRHASIAVLISTVLVATAVQALPDTLWVRFYNGPDNGGDQPNELVVDAAGNCYVTGVSQSLNNGADWVTIKYLPNGGTAWISRADGLGHGTDSPSDLVIDPAGHIIVAGFTTGLNSNVNIRTIKYTPEGNYVYDREFDGPAHGNDIGNAVAVDSAGNAYVVGFVMTPNNSTDWVVIKYRPNGDTAWVRTADGWGHGPDQAYDVAVDRQGNVIVTGFTTSVGGNGNIGIIKYDSSGNYVYVREYDGPAHGQDIAYAVAVDTAGNAYITGSSVGTNNVDCVTIKYMPNGGIDWVGRYNSPANLADRGNAITVDNAGNVYVAGTTVGTTSSYDWLTIKYLPNGDTAWLRRENGWGNADDVAYDIAVGRAGDVFVTGVATNLGNNANIGLVRYLADGTLNWVWEYDGSDAGWDAGLSIALDTSNNIFVTGLSTSLASAQDFVTVKHAAFAGTEERAEPAVIRSAVSGPSIIAGNLQLTARSTCILFDAAGRKVKRLVAGSNKLHQLAPGVYFVYSGQNACQRVVILP